MEELIHRFCLVTGSNSDTAAQYLHMTDGDIERAISVYFDSSMEQGDEASLEDPESCRKPIPQKHERLIEPEPVVPRFNLRTRSNNRNTFSHDPQNNGSSSSSAVPENGNSSAIDQLFEPPYQLLFQGNFEEAKTEAKLKNRWLLVTVHNNTEFECHVMNRDFWTNDKIVKLVKDNFILWQVAHTNRDAHDFTRWYPYDPAYPHLALIDPRTGENKISIQEKKINPQSTHKQLKTFLKELVTGKVEMPGPSSSHRGPLKRKHATIVPAKDGQKSNNHSQNDSDTDYQHDTKKMKLESLNISDPVHSESTSVNTQLSPVTEESMEDYIGNESDPLLSILLRLPNGERDVIVMPSSSKLKAVFLYLSRKGLSLGQHELLLVASRKTLTTKMSLVSLTDCGLVNRDTVIVQEQW